VDDRLPVLAQPVVDEDLLAGAQGGLGHAPALRLGELSSLRSRNMSTFTTLLAGRKLGSSLDWGQDDDKKYADNG
jgi:hypothetical protein